MEGAGLRESFLILRDYFVGSNHRNDAANPAQLVLFAENAAKEGEYGVAAETLQLYFGLNPPTNQFLIRAHLCQALTTSDTAGTAEPEERLQRAVESIVTAVDIAKKSECYHFLVHNASVLLWQICRPHRRPGWAGLCVPGWQSVARAQESCKEEDHEWRLDVLLALLESQVDAGLRDEAGKTAHSVVHLARKKLPQRLPDVLRLCVFHGVGEGKAAEKEMKSVPEFSAISKLYKLKHSLAQGSVKEPETVLRKLVEAVTVEKAPARKTPAQSGKVTPQPHSPEVKAGVLLEIAQVCVEQGLGELCGECLAVLPTGEGRGSRLEVLRHTVTAQLSLLQQTAGLPLYSRTAVEAREQAIAQLSNCLTAAQRLGDLELVQHVGVIVWGVCLPLLQTNLRPRLSHILSTLASALEQADSILHGLRCVIHIELAKVCADQDQLKTALEHIDKARELDRECEWSEQLRWLGERLQLRSELYSTPASPLQQATQLLERVRSSGGCGSKEEMRAILVKVGALLASDHFQVAIGDRPVEPSEQQPPQTEVDTAGEMESCEGDTGEGVSGAHSESDDSEHPSALEVKEKRGESEMEEKKDGEKLYELLKQQIEAHREQVGDSEDTDRCRLWADLAKFARKSQVWDVAFTAARFCLMYDDNRWKVSPVKKIQPSKTGSKLKLQKSSSTSVNRSRSDVSASRSSSLGVVASLSTGPAMERETGRKRGRERLTRDLVRTLAETHFIHAECAVYQLKESGHELGHGLPSPSDQPESAESAEKQVVWPGHLSSDAYTSFLQAGELGCSLAEGWLVANSATFLCNYSHHLLESGSLSSLVTVFRALLNNVVAVREHEAGTETIGGELVCRLSTILAGGLVQKWTPSPPDPTTPDPSREPPGGRKSGRGTATGKKKKGGAGDSSKLQVSPDAGPELQEALGLCERGLAGARDLSLGVQAPLLAVWVRCKQLLQQSVSSKTLGVEEKDGERCVGQCRAVVAVEMLTVTGNSIWDFPDCPTLNEAFELVSDCEWSEDDLLLELEHLARITRLALMQNNYTLAKSCSEHALQDRRSGRQSDQVKLGPAGEKKRQKSDGRREKELLSCISSLHGQALVAGGTCKPATTRGAMESFLQSAKYGKDAGSYQNVVEASRHYWNACRGLVGSPLDREAVRQPLTELLAILTSFLPRRTSHSSADQVVVTEEDLQLHVAIYNVLFQIYIDKGEWEEGLKAVEDAMWVTPRTIHQGLAEYKLVFKSRMGRDVAADMIRFQEAPEEERARLWYKVACNSPNPRLQLTAFQNSITTLTSGRDVWVKIERLLALSEWLYGHHFPAEDALGHLKWAMTLLLDIEEEGKREGEGEVGKREGEGDGGEGEEGEREEEDISECAVREKAVHILVMMARLQGRGSTGHRESCLAALAHCCLLWKATLELYSQSLSGKSSVHLPSTVQEWADFAPTDELRDFVKSANSGGGVNPHSIRTPGLTSHYLGALSDELCGSGLHGLALPVETLRLLLVDCLLQSQAATQLVHLRLARMCGVLGAQRASNRHHSQAGPVFLNPDDVARSRVQICQYQQKQKMVGREGPKRHHSTAVQESHTGSLPPQPLSDVTDTPVLYQVWIEEAALLVEQGQFEISRELLQEAKLSSQALLAAREKRVSECIDYICQAQRCPLSLGQLEEGLRLLLGLAESQQSLSLRKSVVKAVSGAVTALRSGLLGGNRNESRRAEPVLATLQARVTVLQAGVILDSDEGSSGPLTNLCKEMAVHAERLSQLGRREEAAQAMLDHARITIRCVPKATDNASLRAQLLKAVELVKGTVDMLELIFKDTLSLCPLPEDFHAPCERLLIEARLELAKTLLQVSEEYVNEKREERKKQLLKSSIEQMIDDYVRVNPEHGSAKDVWEKVASVAGERALVVLKSVISCGLVQSHTQLKTKCTYVMGRALVLMSHQTSSDPTLTQWRQERGAGSETEDDREGGGEEAKLLQSQQSTISETQKEESASKTELMEPESVVYLNRGSQSLREALSLSLQCGDVEMAAMGALEIVNSWGIHDAKSTALHLAVYQSCVVSKYLLRLLHQVQSDTSESRLAALLHQHSQLGHTASWPPSPSPPPALINAVTEGLASYTCWERHTVTTNSLDLLRHFPHNFRFLILQHSQDKSQLYSAYLIPPQPPPPAAKKGQPPPITVSEMPVVSCVPVSTRNRERLMELVVSSHKLQAQQLLKATPPQECVMSQQFVSIREPMDDYLSPALEPISRALEEEKSDEGLTVVLLADFELLKLPLEALKLLQSDRIKAVSRDFSLQMHYLRIKKFLADEEDAGAKKKEKFQLQPSNLQANATNFRYILDPRCDMSNNNSEPPPNKIVSQINAFPKITSKWSGHKGIATEQAMSSSQWYPLLEQCSGLLFLGSERLLAHFPASQLAPLSMPDCSIAIVMDHSQTMISSILQSKLDLHKRREDLELEQSVQTAALLSLAGVNCLLSRQWHSTVDACTDSMCTFLKKLLSEGIGVAEMRWQEMREKHCQPSEGQTDSDTGAVPTEPSPEQRDYSSAFNTTVYGLPHLALTLPST